jgi:hypothetical protein
MIKASKSKSSKNIILFAAIRYYIVYPFLGIAISGLLLFLVALPLFFNNFVLGFLEFFLLLISAMIILTIIDKFNYFWKGFFNYYMLYQGKEGRYYKRLVQVIIFLLLIINLSITIYLFANNI